MVRYKVIEGYIYFQVFDKNQNYLFDKEIEIAPIKILADSKEVLDYLYKELSSEKLRNKEILIKIDTESPHYSQYELN